MQVNPPNCPGKIKYEVRCSMFDDHVQINAIESAGRRQTNRKTKDNNALTTSTFPSQVQVSGANTNNSPY